MNKILRKIEIAPKIYEMVVEAPRVARKAQPGQFVVVMADQRGERIPLTIADFDRAAGTLTMVLMTVGASSLKLSRLDVGDDLFALIGPLGQPSEIHNYNTAVMVAGGVGTAPIYPIARALRENGCRVITIQGARSKNLLFWTDRIAAVSDQHIIMTDDGTCGRKGLVTEPLSELLADDAKQPNKNIGCVYAIGPTVMMKFCAQATRPFNIPTIVSLNTVMVDGTGMCGGCRVDLGGQTRFTCTDGPEFDGHLVNWDELLHRQKIYVEHESCSLMIKIFLQRTDRKSTRLNSSHSTRSRMPSSA
jgi:ferredoxin--NADP+ reductase